MDETIERMLPYFPLNISLLPGEDLPLRVFEPRYKQLINDCGEDAGSFGIPFTKHSEMQAYGSEVRVKQIVATNSVGEMVIVVEGLTNFEVVSFQDPLPGKLYSGGIIQVVNNDQPIKDKALLQLLLHYTNELDPEFLKDVNGNEILLNDVARALNLSSEDKFKFISYNRQDCRERFLLSQMKYLVKLREQENLLNNDYFLN
ncbi:MAG TPA: LON peptidase substrate-binding domain-containing protein [Bacteroidales bacterium]|nr:LON peptidase substrate-binding domain-containing protein [Bacteroidales bacterium]